MDHTHQQLYWIGVLRLCGILALGLTLSLATPATAGPLEDASAAALHGDYATELKLLEPLADRGNVDAQYNLGVMYQNGQGMAKDHERAAFWYRKAADQRHIYAQYDLAYA